MKSQSEKHNVGKGCHWQIVCQCHSKLVRSTAGQASSGTRRCLILFLLLVLAGCEKQAPKLTAIDGETMGTTYSIKISPQPAQSSLDDLHEKIDARLEEINDAMSTWRANSELSRFNKSESNEWFPVSGDTAKVVRESLRIAKLSNGAFDPTVSPLVNLWSFGNKETKPQLPDEKKIQEALLHVGYQKIQVRLNPSSLKKTDVKTTLDLSAIAKGFGVDEIGELLENEGYENYLVEIGGEVRTRGSKGGGQGWKIGIQSPQSQSAKVHSKVSLSNQSMATSGDYRNFFEVDGKRYSHAINPATGKPVQHSLASVSVIADNCMTADALATAFMVLGSEKAIELAKEMEVAAYFLERDGNVLNGDVLKEMRTPGFSKFVEKPEPAKWGTMFLVTLVVFLIAVLLMAVGVILGKIRIKGSCGGLAGMTNEEGNPMCESCTTPPEECSRFQKAMQDSDEGHHSKKNSENNSNS